MFKVFSLSFSSSSFSLIFCSQNANVGIFMSMSKCICAASKLLNAYQLKHGSVEKCYHTLPRFYFVGILHQDAHISDEASVMYSRAKQVINKTL